MIDSYSKNKLTFTLLLAENGEFEEKKMGAGEEIRHTQTPLMAEKLESLGNSSAGNHAIKSRAVPRQFSLLIRSLVCDFPMMVLLLTYFSLRWLSHVHDNYIHEQLKAMLFTSKRRAEEITYYSRPCTREDMSTHTGADLFLPADATVEDAYQHQLKHGFTVFPSVLSPETTAALRAHISERNTFNSTDSESIFVIANDKRYSFGLGTEEPVVAGAMAEIASHKLLRPSLERILGRNPALIEMTAITSSYGAKDQYWHDDVIPTGSVIRYGRSFGPHYSIFIQLQDTTKAMGATEACPGSHFCSAGGVDSMCEEEGFQIVGHEGYWNGGDALLMNMNSFHRGTAHTDPKASDRVMLILTFTTKPRSRAESRQLSQGITFSLRWDEWGHTLDDMRKATTIMQKPWTILRALGLYKLPGTEWGIDYVTGGSMRMANEDNGFTEHEFEDFMEKGGFAWLPGFLQGRPTDEDEGDYSWYEYYQETGNRCLYFVKVKLLPIGTGAYLLLFLGVGVVSGKGHRLDSIKNAIVRLCLMGGIAYFLYNAAIERVDGTNWAKDIRFKKRHWGVFKNQFAFGIKTQGPTTFPHRRDVLVENRYGSEYLAMYEDFIDGHPGNRFFNEYLTAASEGYHYYPEVFKNATVHYVHRAVQDSQGRFLYQGPVGNWQWLNQAKALAFTRRKLAAWSHPYKKMLARRIRHIVSDCMYGVHRFTKLSQNHAVPYMRTLERKLIGEPDLPDLSLPETEKTNQAKCVLEPTWKLQNIPKTSKLIARRERSLLPPAVERQEPEDGAWITVDDWIECLEEDEYWYVAQVDGVSAHGEYFVSWTSGGTGICEWGYVRRFRGYSQGQEVEVFNEKTVLYDELGEVVRVNDDGSYDLEMEEEGGIYRSVSVGRLRRPAEDGDSDVATYQAAY